MIKFTPKKFLDVLELNDIKLTHLVNLGINREYFIPRYKKGSRRIEDLGDFQKRIRRASIEKIADILVDFGYFEERETIIFCFINDDFEPLVPEDLL